MMKAIGLRSLWDMLKDNASTYVDLGKAISDLLMSIGMNADKKAEWVLEDEQFAAGLLAKISNLCARLGLPVTEGLAKTPPSELCADSSTFGLFSKALELELKSKLFFFVPDSRAKFYQSEPSLVIAGFSGASSELRRAGNCLAFGEYTASVFHAMRAAEISLRVLANAIPSVTLDPAIAQWGNVIEQIEKGIKELGQQQKSSDRDAKLQLYSAAASQLRYFKDAWRNHVSHSKEIYDEDLARSIFTHVMEFVEGLSPALSE